MVDEQDFTRPTYTEHVGSTGTRFFNHDKFLFYDKPEEFSYQHNPRGILGFIEGVFDLPDTMDEDSRLYRCWEYFTILECALKLGEDISWDVSCEVTIESGETFRFINENPFHEGDMDLHGLADMTDWEADNLEVAEDKLVTIHIPEIRMIRTWFDT